MRSYTGYVHLPPGALNDTGDSHQDYPINSFFWFFEARKDPENAPLAIWLNGGPGASSMLGLFAENGPCHVNSDSNSTYLNEWSWNNEVNMLYLDQPVQVGFSYDILQKITKNLAENDITVLENNATEVPEQNNTLIVGTYPSQNSNHTAHGVRDAAKAAWHFMQTFTQEFPEYHPNDSRISVTTESFVSLHRASIRIRFVSFDMLGGSLGTRVCGLLRRAKSQNRRRFSGRQRHSRNAFKPRHPVHYQWLR